MISAASPVCSFTLETRITNRKVCMDVDSSRLFWNLPSRTELEHAQLLNMAAILFTHHHIRIFHSDLLKLVRVQTGNFYLRVGSVDITPVAGRSSKRRIVHVTLSFSQTCCDYVRFIVVKSSITALYLPSIGFCCPFAPSAEPTVPPSQCRYGINVSEITKAAVFLVD